MLNAVEKVMKAGGASMKVETKGGRSGDAELAVDLYAVYGAYQFLRDHDLTTVSSTSCRLHEADLPALTARVRDEVDELRGVIAGTHGHGGGEDDVVLEASQCLYWTFVLAIAAGDAYDDLSPHVALLGTADSAGAMATLTHVGATPGEGTGIAQAGAPALDGAKPDVVDGEAAAEDARSDYDGALVVPGAVESWADDAARHAALRAVLSTVGDLCLQGGVHPHTAVARDLADLRTRPYLDAYWASVSPFAAS